MTPSDVAAWATAVGVVIAVVQLWLSRQQAKTQFEDALGRQYREILERLPVAALLGEAVELSDPRVLGAFYRYVDLCNEQVFLRSERRIRGDTWANWVDGIKGNLVRPAFKAAWEQIKAKSPGSFDELRRLESEGYARDPAGW